MASISVPLQFILCNYGLYSIDSSGKVFSFFILPENKQPSASTYVRYFYTHSNTVVIKYLVYIYKQYQCYRFKANE